MGEFDNARYKRNNIYVNPTYDKATSTVNLFVSGEAGDEVKIKWGGTTTPAWTLLARGAAGELRADKTTMLLWKLDH